MKNIIHLKNPIIPTKNQVLIKIKDTYDEKMSAGGVILPNAAHFESEADSTGYTLSEWIIRSGVIEKLPRVLTNSNYDWYPNDELKEGDKVHWPIVKFFEYPVIKTENDDMFLLVNYHDIHLKEVDGEPIPVNGFFLFKQLTEEEKVFEHTLVKDSQWHEIVAIGEEIRYEHEPFNYEHDWKIGDKCILNVPPFKLEAETTREFKEQYFLAQKRHILFAL